MEGITKPTLLALLGGECLDWLQVEVVVKMQVVQVFTVNQQIQHIVTLATDLEEQAIEPDTVVSLS